MNIWLKRAFVLLTLSLGGVALAQEADQQAMMEEWMKNMTPGEMHQMLAAFDGKWKASMTMWNANNPPEKSEGTAENKMIMGGRYQVSELKLDMMGMPFHGMGTTAYDNASKSFKSTWIDNAGTSISMSEGSYDPASKTLTMKGEMYMPGMGNTKFKTKLTENDKDKHTFTMFMMMGEQEVKSMEIVYTRAQ